MKYAIIGPRGGILRVFDEEQPGTVELSDELATQAAATVGPILIDGQITSHQLERQNGFKITWNEETKSWDRSELPPPPTPPVPKSVTATQIRLWLVRNGITLDMVYAAIDAIPDAQTKKEAYVLWEYAPYVERNNPFVAMLGQAFNLNDAAIDNAFRQAKTIL